MGTRQLVKSGKLSAEMALTNLLGLRKQSQFVSDEIIHWLERRLGTRVARQSRQQKKRNKR